MSRFTSCLWKEWRENRVLVLALPAIALLLIVGREVVDDASAVGCGAVPGIAALLAFATTVLAFFGDTFAGEERRGTIAFLRRQPGGWWPPFAAKYALVLAASAAITTWTWSVAAACAWWLHGVAPEWMDARALELFVEMVLLVPLWTITVSIWLPRSSLALPAAALVLAAFLAPIAVACWVVRGKLIVQTGNYDELGQVVGVLRPSLAQVAWALRIALVGAPVVAALSFARGRAVERGPFRAAAVGLVAMLVLCAPAYAWAAVRVVDYERLEPGSDEARFDVNSACVATGGRVAYLNLRRRVDDRAWRANQWARELEGPFHALQVDLATGAWKEVAPVGASIWSSFDPLQKGTTPYVVVQDALPLLPPRSASAPVSREPQLLDAESGEVARSRLDAEFFSAEDETGARFQRLANSLVLPDGGRAWFEHGHLVRTDRDGNSRVLPDSTPPARSVLWFTGRSLRHGFAFGGRAYYDVLNEQRFELPNTLWVHWIHSGECIVRPTVQQPNQLTVFKNWSRWLIATRELVPIVGLADADGSHESIEEMADDGRLFVAAVVGPTSDAPPRLWLLDPATGAREPVELPDRVRDWTGVHVIVRGRTPSGLPVMAIHHGKYEHHVFARLDLASRRFLVADTGTGDFELVGVDSEDSILVSDGRRLLRARFDRPGVEVVFPKSDG